MINLKTEVKPYYSDEFVTIYNADCLEFMGNIVEGQVDCIMTDPPYGMNWQSGRRKEKYEKIVNDEDVKWIDEWVDKSYVLLKNDRHFYSFCSWHNIDAFKIGIAKKFEVKNILVWKKNNHGSGDLQGNYAPIYENIVFASKGKRKLNGLRESNVLEFDKTGNDYHPTEKPESLIAHILRKSCDKGYLVLDMFAGSGTAGVACKMLGLQCVLIEKDEKHCETIVKRLNFTSMSIGYIGADVESDGEQLGLGF